MEYAPSQKFKSTNMSIRLKETKKFSIVSFGPNLALNCERSQVGENSYNWTDLTSLNGAIILHELIASWLFHVTNYFVVCWGLFLDYKIYTCREKSVFFLSILKFIIRKTHWIRLHSENVSDLGVTMLLTIEWITAKSKKNKTNLIVANSSSTRIASWILKIIMYDWGPKI
jgi:hypothetical protein